MYNDDDDNDGQDLVLRACLMHHMLPSPTPNRLLYNMCFVFKCVNVYDIRVFMPVVCITAKLAAARPHNYSDHRRRSTRNRV